VTVIAYFLPNRFYYYTEEIPLQNEIIASVMKYEKTPDMWEIENNADLLLINSYEILNNIRPTVPSTVYLGGLHEKHQKTDLPEDLREFLKKSEKVVYVNLNSAIQQSQVRFEKLLKALEKTNVDIIWNSHDTFINTTSRVYQGFDLDQESILGESN
jgi:cation transport regulator ChaB